MKGNKLLKFTALETTQMRNIKGGGRTIQGGAGQPGAVAKVRIRGNGSV